MKEINYKNWHKKITNKLHIYYKILIEIFYLFLKLMNTYILLIKSWDHQLILTKIQ